MLYHTHTHTTTRNTHYFDDFLILQYVLLLCNALGTPLESKYINMGQPTSYPPKLLILVFHKTLFISCLVEPRFVALSHTHVVAASKSCLFIWHYRTASRLAVSELTHLSRRGWEGQERSGLIPIPPCSDSTRVLIPIQVDSRG